LNLEELLLKTKDQLKNELPFVLYRKPNAKTISGLFGRTSEMRYLKSFEESDYVVDVDCHIHLKVKKKERVIA